MSLLIQFDKKQKRAYVSRSVHKRYIKGKLFWNKSKSDKLIFEPIEALYLIDVRKAKCTTPDHETELKFNEVASEFSTGKKFMARYFTYKDWRDRGLIIKSPQETKKKPQRYRRRLKNIILNN